MPAKVVDPCKKKMMDNAKNPTLFTNWSHAWICGHQRHKTNNIIRLIRFLFDLADMAKEGLYNND